MTGIDTKVCETYSPVRMWLVEVEAVEVEEAGTARTRADSCCQLDSELPAQVVEVEVHIGHTLRAYRTADNIHQRRVHKQEHFAAAEGGVDTDRK